MTPNPGPVSILFLITHYMLFITVSSVHFETNGTLFFDSLI